MSEDLNHVALIGRATRDAELASTSGGTSVLKIRLAVNGRRKGEGGEWVDAPNFFDVAVWGTRADALAPYITKGKRIGVGGSLRWREWEASDGSGKRQAVEVVATTVQFLDPRGEQPSAGGEEGTPDFVPSGHSDDDIPF
jgi:single-strand DNA-binding protein